MLTNLFNKNTIRKIKVLLVIIFTVALASLIIRTMSPYLRMSEGFTNGELSTTKDAYLSSITQNTKDSFKKFLNLIKYCHNKCIL